jgi:hypothetical protein
MTPSEVGCTRGARGGGLVRVLLVVDGIVTGCTFGTRAERLLVEAGGAAEGRRRTIGAE